MELKEELFQEETINIKEIIHKVWRHWEYFVISIILCLITAYFYNKRLTPIYQTSSTILINEENSAFDPQALLNLEYRTNRNNILNEIEILRSQSLLTEVFKRMNCDISYYAENSFSTNEIYNNNPFDIVPDSNFNLIDNYQIEATIFSPDSIELIFNEGFGQRYSKNNTPPNNEFIPYQSMIVQSGDTIKNNFFNFIFALNDSYSPEQHSQHTYFFKFCDLKNKIQEFSNINISPIDNSSVIKITLTHHNLVKSIDFLNTLTQVFLDKELKRKNQVALKSLQFIESHLNEINDSLYQSEQSLLKYQTDKGALNIDFQTQKMFEQLEQLQSDKAELLIQEKYFKYLEQTLKKSSTFSDIIAPSIMNVQNQILNNQISNLLTIQSELNNVKLNSENQNPYIKSLVSRIENAKKVLLEYINNEQNNLQIAVADINSRLDKSIARINRLPKTQRELFNYERNYKVYDNIYTFLLQKRSETMLALASNVPLNEVVDRAQITNYKIISKNARTIYLIAILLGIILPGLYIFIIGFFNNKILSDQDIEKETDLPILGRIIKSKGSEMAFGDPKSLISESFRMLRTNLDFARKGGASQVILVTSTMQGEGKSFVSDNLAHSLALNNKKTILLLFDLRKPRLYLDTKYNGNGLSSFLINKSTIKDIISQTEIDNLDIIQAGSLPPNPAELISSDKTEDLINELKKQYDFVIIDTPPIGIISDGLNLTKFASIVLFVVRYNYTKTKPLAHILKSVNGKIKNLNIVANSLELGKNAYSYDYGYGYGKYGNYEY